MALKDIGIGKRKYDMTEKPWNTPWYLKVLEWFILLFYRITAGIKVRKRGFDKINGPCLVLQNHGSVIDFALTLRAFKLRSMAWVCSIEEFIKREWLMRSLGCIYKRKFTPDVKVVSHIAYAIRKQNKPVVIYPEARFALAGINEETDFHSYARLIKMLKVPVVMAIAKGNFICSPQWAKKPTKKIPVSCDYNVVLTSEQVAEYSSEQIEKTLTENFVYDDYAYWQNSGYKIKSKVRAKGIHKILYQCPHCGKEFSMDSEGTTLFCKECGSKWELDEHGKLHGAGNETYFEHVPDWYRWERENVNKEVAEGKYKFTSPVVLNRLVSSAKGFEKLGTVTLTHDENGFTMQGKLDNGEDFYFNRTALSMYSVHIEYNYKGNGETIDLATQNETYFVQPEVQEHLTKIHFATEALHKIAKEREEQEKTESVKE